jgi:nucleolar protein 16
MGRELQKKKNRSSIPKVKRNGKSKKKMLSNPIIAANWYLSALRLPTPHANS